MKKYLFIVAAATLAACNNETLVDVPQPVENEVAIGFGTGLSNMTRGGVDDKNAAENSTATTPKYALSKYHDTFYVWGYKRVELSDTEHTYTTVFNGIDDVVTVGTAEEKHALVTWGTDWTYAPARFWDKSATYYNFYAVAPSQYDWIATDNDGVAITDNDYMDDEDDVKFSLKDFTTDGLSLAQNAGTPTTSETSLFAKDTQTNPDLMISNDIIKHTDYTGNRVNFEFNHILSRLNIAVKKDAATLESACVKITELKVYNLKNTGDFAEAFGTTGLTAETLKAGTDLRWTKDDLVDTALPVVGVEFANGSTAAAPTTTKDAVVNTTTSYINDADIDAATNIVTTGYNYLYQSLVIPQTVKFNSCKLNGIDVYDKGDKTAKDKDIDAFIKVSYTIDGEPFTYFYNLAEVFSNVNAQYTKTVNSDTYTAYKTVGDGIIWEKGGNYYVETSTNNFEETTTYVLFDGTKFYDPANTNAELFQGTNGKLYATQDDADAMADGTEVYATATYAMCDASLAMIPVLRKEVNPSLGECDVTFCEGWQNNLKITIKPTAILFTGEVFQWVTDKEYEFTVE